MCMIPWCLHTIIMSHVLISFQSLSLCMSCTGFYGKRKAIDFKTTKAYIEKPVTDPLNIQWMVAEILQQKERSLDCGNGCFCGVCLHWRFVNPFSRSYRQYVCGVCLHCVGRYQHRRRYKALIWDYATKKQERWVNQ